MSKQKRGKIEHGSLSAVPSGAALSLEVEAAQKTSAELERKGNAMKMDETVMAMCRTASVKSPAVFRTILAKYQPTSINPALVTILEYVS